MDYFNNTGSKCQPQEASPKHEQSSYFNDSKSLLSHHRDHLKSEGFSDEQIEKLRGMGVCSITAEEAEKQGFKVKDANGQWQSSSGLYFPFAAGFGQIRCDEPPTRANGTKPKYLTPCGAKSEAWLPEGCKVITEGAKDAYAGTLIGGLATGALAGVSHARKALEPKSRHVVLFDADAWQNPSVFNSLMAAAIHLSGKIQIVPEVAGQSKAGLCEYFKQLAAEGKNPAEEYKNLIGSALKREDALLDYCDRLGAIQSRERLDASVHIALKWAAKILNPTLQELAIAAINKSAGLSTRLLKERLTQHINRIEREKQKQLKAKQGYTSLIKMVFPKKGGEARPELQPAAFPARILAEELRETLAFNVEQQCFYRYSVEQEGIWQREQDSQINSFVQAQLDARDAADMYSARYVSDVVKLLQGYLSVRHWNQAESLLPMVNGVLNLKTRELLPHAPGYRLTWRIPYSFNSLATCEPIQQWLLSTQDGDQTRVELLRAYLKAVVCGRSDLQRYVELLGPGGSGKSTFANLAIALVGMTNVAITNLQNLEHNRFETSTLLGKRLVYITDSERYGGSVSVLKSVTGGDPLRYEEKNKQQLAPFIPRLMVLMAANEPIQSSDYTSGLERRRITVPFLNPVAVSHQRDLLTINHYGLSGEFVDYLPGLLNWVLDLPDSEMKRLLKETQVSVPSLNRWKQETLIESNPLADWLDTCCVLYPEAKAYIGVATPVSITNGEPGNSTTVRGYARVHELLYANYRQHCDRTGASPVKIHRFSRLVLDLINHQLKQPATKGKDKFGAYLRGVTIRTSQHDAFPSPVTGWVMGGDDRVTVESPVDDEFDGYDGFFETQDDQQKKSLSPNASLGDEKNSLCNVSCSENSSQSSNSSSIDVSAITDPSPQSSPPAIARYRGDGSPEWRSDNDPFWLQHFPGSDGEKPVTRKNRALQIRNEMLKAKSKADLERIGQKWGEWSVPIWQHLLTNAEQNQILTVRNQLEIGGQQ